MNVFTVLWSHYFPTNFLYIRRPQSQPENMAFPPRIWSFSPIRPIKATDKSSKLCTVQSEILLSEEAGVESSLNVVLEVGVDEGNSDTLAEVSGGDGALGSVGEGVPLDDGLLATSLARGGDDVELGVVAEAVVLDVEVGVVLEDGGVVAAGLELGVGTIGRGAVGNAQGRVVGEVVVVVVEVDDDVLEVVAVALGGDEVLVLVLGEVPRVHDAPVAVLEPAGAGVDLAGAGVALAVHGAGGLEAGAGLLLAMLFHRRLSSQRVCAYPTLPSSVTTGKGTQPVTTLR